MISFLSKISSQCESNLSIISLISSGLLISYHIIYGNPLLLILSLATIPSIFISLENEKSFDQFKNDNKTFKIDLTYFKSENDKLNKNINDLLLLTKSPTISLISNDIGDLNLVLNDNNSDYNSNN